MKDTVKPRALRWLLIVLVTLAVICFSDMTCIKHVLLRIPPVNHKGITRTEFESVGDKIVVGMDRSVLASLESLSSEIQRNDLSIDIQWDARVARKHSVMTTYHIKISIDGKIAQIKKLNGWIDHWD